MSIKIGPVVKEQPEVVEPGELDAYVLLSVYVDDAPPVWVWTMVGVPAWQQGTCRAAGGDPAPYLDTWWADGNDWLYVPQGRMREVQEALKAAAPRLWREVVEGREADRKYREES